MKMQKKQSTLMATLLMLVFSITAQTSIERNRDAIKSMLGCFEVSFKYTETFAPEVDYEQAYDYTSEVLEWAVAVEDDTKKISIQHLLVISDTMVIKHWRQEWTFEDKRIFEYDKDNKWMFKTLDKAQVADTWAQEVFQVDDSPRYSGYATWFHADGRHIWYSEAYSPLPRREYTKRSDYNIMLRKNRIKITNEGWIHEQDNDKIIRDDQGTDRLLVQEKGFNTYVKVANSRCKAAQEWWSKHKEEWAEVRMVWDDYYENVDSLELELKVDDKRLYEHLFFHPEPLTATFVESTIEKYIK